MTDAAINTRTTYFYERLRAIATGITETASTTFLLLIAVRWFEAGATYKALIAGASSFGFFLAPFIVHLAESKRLSVTYTSAICFALSSCGYLVAACISNIHVFVWSSLLAVTTVSMCVPLIVQMYQENYPAERRGRLLSGSVMIRIAIAMCFSQLAGQALDGRLEYFQLLMLVFCLASAFSSYCIGRCPSKIMEAPLHRNPLHGLSYIRSDKVFRNTLICWMLMGFANLMMIPLRVEYLANPEYRLNLSISNIALLVGVVPNAARFVLSPLWGRLFDRMNFFSLRIILNTGFMIGILTFFASASFEGLLIGAIVFGISNAGGDIAWSLWVTKFAPPEKVADYMAVHTFLTGIRGIVAPFAAFQMLAFFTPRSLGFFSAFLILAASAMLIPEYFVEKRKRKVIAQSGYLESL